jgi:nitrate/nitrite transporter NarK
VPFVITIFMLGFFMSLGKAAVYKHIPVYYPDHVGSVGGLVGLVGGLGGFVLPIVFGAISDLTGIWTSCFMVLFALVAVALAWMHFAIRQMEQKAAGIDTRSLPQFPEMAGIHDAEVHAEHGVKAKVLTDWRPEDSAFWEETGQKIANRNLYLSIPALLLAFSVWMVWSVVVAKLPLIGFDYTTDQLFWLAALPGLSGATFRIFYSFMVPIFGGRLWTTLSTASLLIPAFGIGYAVQNPDTPYFIFLVLALLCGFGGGNFASSMSNIGFFFPKAKKGHALAINAGLGNLGVSVMQYVVPLVITAGVFGAVGGDAQATKEGAARQESVPRCQRAQVRVPWPAGRRGQPGCDRLGIRPLGRRAGDLLGVPGNDPGRDERGPLPQCERLHGLPRKLRVHVLRDGRGQCLDLPDDPEHHAPGSAAADARARRSAAHPPGRKGIGRDRRLHLGDRGLRRLLHPARLRDVDQRHRHAACRALWLHRLLRELRRPDLVGLHPERRPAARC